MPRDLPKIYLRYSGDLPKISLKYAKGEVLIQAGYGFLALISFIFGSIELIFLYDGANVC